jgi:hypothetical protein
MSKLFKPEKMEKSYSHNNLVKTECENSTQITQILQIYTDSGMTEICVNLQNLRYLCAFRMDNDGSARKND